MGYLPAKRKPAGPARKACRPGPHSKATAYEHWCYISATVSSAMYLLLYIPLWDPLLCICLCVSAAVYPPLCIRRCVSAAVDLLPWICH